MKKFLLTIIPIILIAAGGGYWYFTRPPSLGGTEQARGFIVKRQDLRQTVSLTGIVQATNKADLSFDRGGKVTRVFFDVGSAVKTGGTLVTLANSDLLAAISQAEANIAFEEARLAELKRGPRPEDLEIAQVKVENAKVALEEARRNLASTLIDAFTKSDDAIRNGLDGMISNPSSQPTIAINSGDSQLKTQIERSRIVVEAVLKKWSLDVHAIDASGDLVASSSAAEANLSQVRSLLQSGAMFLDSATPSSAIDQYKIAIGTGRANVELARGNIAVAREKVANLQSSITLAEAEELKIKSGYSAQEISAQTALLQRAQASLQNARVNLSKTVLSAPFDGIIIRQDVKVGESVNPSQNVVTLSGAHLQVKVNIPESDIAKVSLGNKAGITLDAYGSAAEFPATLIQIEPGETIIEGVATYKSILQFVTDDPRVKSGMTANIEVISAEKLNVLVVPRRGLVKRGGGYLVRVLKAGVALERPVEIGIAGGDSLVEITKGLAEGEQIQIP